MKMLILILALARLIDWIIEKSKPTLSRPADFAKHRANWVEEERSQPSPDIDEVEVDAVDSIEWCAKTRKVIDIKFKEV